MTTMPRYDLYDSYLIGIPSILLANVMKSLLFINIKFWLIWVTIANYGLVEKYFSKGRESRLSNPALVGTNYSQ